MAQWPFTIGPIVRCSGHRPRTGRDEDNDVEVLTVPSAPLRPVYYMNDHISCVSLKPGGWLEFQDLTGLRPVLGDLSGDWEMYSDVRYGIVGLGTLGIHPFDQTHLRAVEEAVRRCEGKVMPDDPDERIRGYYSRTLSWMAWWMAYVLANCKNPGTMMEM